KIVDRSSREQAVKIVEVNETDDISDALGLTTAPDLHGTQLERNETAQEAHAKPHFERRGKTRVTTAEETPYAVEILIKNRFDGPATAAPVIDRHGRAYVDIPPTKYYEVRLYNDADYEAVGNLLIDGLE